MIISGILRGVQILFGAVVLGLSITLIRGQGEGGVSGVPAITNYGAFTGAFGILIALVGIAALFVEALQGIIMMGIDGLCALFYLAGGIAFAVKLRGISCGEDSDANVYNMFRNDMLNGGCIGDGARCEYNTYKLLSPRCREATADYVFMFFAFITCIAAAGLAFFSSSRRGGGAGGIV